MNWINADLGTVGNWCISICIYDNCWLLVVSSPAVLKLTCMGTGRGNFPIKLASREHR